MITLSSSDEFLNDAARQYDALPQETSQIYKKHFISIPFELKNYLEAKGGAQDEKVFISDIINGSLKDINMKFDLVLGSETVENSNAKYVAIVTQGDIDASGRMHQNDDKFAAFMNANSKSVVKITVPAGDAAKLNFLMVNSNSPLNVQVVVELGDNSSLELFELCVSNAASTSSLGLMHEIRQGRDATAEINTVHNENDKTVVLAFAKNSMGQNSQLRFNTLYNGGTHSRARNSFRAEAKDSTVEVNEVVFGAKEQKFDINTYVINQGKESHASLESKAALMDTSFCMLKGYAKVEKGASKSRSYVHERGILMDKGAKVDGLPDMSVDENDVKATHSSATSPVDTEAVFYMMSKGITERWVKKLLINGFFAESMAKMGSSSMKEISMSLINSKLETKSYGQMPQIGIKDMWIIASDVGKDGIFKGHYKYREG